MCILHSHRQKFNLQRKKKRTFEAAQRNSITFNGMIPEFN